MRKPLQPSDRASGPEPHETVLAGGQSFVEKFGGPVVLESIDAARHVKRIAAIEAGEIGLDRVQDEDIDKLIRHATPETKQDRLNQAAKLLGQSPAARVVKREIVSVATLEGIARDGGRALDTNSVAQLSAISDEDTSPAAKTHRLYNVREAMQGRRDAGAVFRNLTGFGIGHKRADEVLLLDDDDRPVIKLAPETAQMLGGDRRFDKALRLLKQAHRGDRPENLNARIAAAVKAAEGGERDKAIGDAWVFEDTADRVRVAEESFAALSRPDTTPAARAVAMLTLTTALAAETMPRERALQMLMDTVPLLGNLRAAEATLESGKAALAAFERGDSDAGWREAGATVLNALGAIAGTATPVAAVGNKVVRTSVRRAASLGKERAKEFDQARKTGTSDAARRRIEVMANRDKGEQLLGVDRSAYDAVFDHLSPEAAHSVRGEFGGIIGDAGEHFFEKILRRWKPDARSGVQAKRLLAEAERRGDDRLQAQAKALLHSLKIKRHSYSAKPDVMVDGVDVSTVAGVNKLSDNASIELPTVVDVKTGGIKKGQKKSYEENARVNELPYVDPQTIEKFFYAHVNGDEWRSFLKESFDENLVRIVKSGRITKIDAEKLRKKALVVFEVADVKNWIKLFLDEQVAAVIFREIER